MPRDEQSSARSGLVRTREFHSALRMICRDLEGFTGLDEIGSLTMERVHNTYPTGEHVMGKMETNVKDALD